MSLRHGQLTFIKIYHPFTCIYQMMIFTKIHSFHTTLFCVVLNNRCVPFIFTSSEFSIFQKQITTMSKQLQNTSLWKPHRRTEAHRHRPGHLPLVRRTQAGTEESREGGNLTQNGDLPYNLLLKQFSVFDIYVHVPRSLTRSATM